MDENRFSYKQHYNAPLMIGEAFDGNKKLTVQEMVELLNKQQATIERLVRKLKKYAKIGEEQLKQIIELQEENEKLRKELDNFKPVMFQDVRKGTVILYSKGDIDE